MTHPWIYQTPLCIVELTIRRKDTCKASPHPHPREKPLPGKYRGGTPGLDKHAQARQVHLRTAGMWRQMQARHRSCRANAGRCPQRQKRLEDMVREARQRYLSWKTAGLHDLCCHHGVLWGAPGTEDTSAQKRTRTRGAWSHCLQHNQLAAKGSERAHKERRAAEVRGTNPGEGAQVLKGR